ncbi:MAG: hypothetical protein GY834_02275 [Bacteroidetes bacterium]|nr:hypothetical protein [Bacteroidota bacterium]
MKVKCPKCETITEFEGKGIKVICSNEKCLTDSGNRRQVKVEPNKIKPKKAKVLKSTPIVPIGTPKVPMSTPMISIKRIAISTLSRCKNNKWSTLNDHAKIVIEWLKQEGVDFDE